MPHTRSARKNARKSAKLRLRNRSTKKAIKNELKKFDELAAKGPSPELSQEIIVAIRKLDKAAARRIIHPNLAARKKSQLARLINTKQAAGQRAS
jgi:small subunit ribosomal protein S20